ncbi:hypothetical protein JW906_00750 [bacterium]|nr:hypothetical protein [bacterium]
MPDMGTSKKVTRVGGGETPSAAPKQPGTLASIDKGKAKKFRIFAVLCWIIAIAFEIGAIVLLKKPPVGTAELIFMIAVDFIFALIGIVLWKKANRYDPASEKEKIRFFVQNQLGVFIAIIAFLPLVVLILTSKDLKGKQKGILGAVAVVAMLIAAIAGIDFNPPSLEQYAEQTARVEALTGANHVYWTPHGSSYHIYSDCSYINTDRTSEIFEGTVAQARELKNITDLCDRCAARAEREKLPQTR